MSGTLFVVATPLGNLDDMPPRALEALRSSAIVACEDTRRTAKLLSHFGIDVRTISCHRFNEQRRLEPLLDALRAGQDVALVSDGGTPGVSDPGARLVAAALESGIRVSPLPGPSAVTALLSASGLPGERYVFEGFLPHRAGERRKRLRALKDEVRTVVFFEAPHRILDTLQDVGDVLGKRPLVLGRELTKLHETLVRGTASEIAGKLGGDVRGEITFAMAGASEVAPDEEADVDARRVLACWRDALERSGGDRRRALRSAARTLGVGRAELNRRLAELGDPD